MQFCPPRSSLVPIAGTPVCNITDNKSQDIPPVPVVDTLVCNNDNISIHDIPSPLSDTVSLHQTPVTPVSSLIPTCILNLLQ